MTILQERFEQVEKILDYIDNEICEIKTTCELQVCYKKLQNIKNIMQEIEEDIEERIG